MDDGFHVPLAVGVMALLEHACHTAIPSALLPFIQSVLHYRLKTLLEIERMHALPSWLCRDGAPMPWVGFKAQQVRHGLGPRRVATWQDEPEAGLISLDTLAQNIVKWQLRDLQGVCHGAIRALAKAGVVGAKVTGMMDGTNLEAIERYSGCGQMTRPVRIEDTRGQVHTIEVTVYGWKVLLMIETVTKIALAVKVEKGQENATH
jgi:hypothetical protein